MRRILSEYISLGGFMALSAMVLVLSCNSKPVNEQPVYTSIRGETMGTTYYIQCSDAPDDLGERVDSILAIVNQGLSTYIPESTISLLNTKGSIAIATGPAGQPEAPHERHFLNNISLAQDVYDRSNGAFDPTVGPLVNAWGFGWQGRVPVAPSDRTIDSLLALVGYDKLVLDTLGSAIEIALAKPGMILDFSAVAKGYGVDVVCEFMESLGIGNLFVEIGGEVRTEGKSARGDEWIVGINTPSSEAGLDEVFARVRLTDLSMATSGNYRNYYTIDGRRVWHTIDPVTGYPEENAVLSVSILHRHCAVSDALATACMVLGLKEGFALAESYPGAEGYFVYDDSGSTQVQFTSGFSKYIIE